MRVCVIKLSFLLFCSLFVHFQLAGPIYISLGRSCEPALSLRSLGLRYEAFPFDWLIAPFDGLMQTLKEDFTHLLDDLVVRKDQYGVIDYYGLHYIHDWPTIANSTIDVLAADYISNKTLASDWEIAVPLVKEKYRRRIMRFKHVCNGEDKIYFIRNQDITKEQAIILRDYFIETYPELNFVLVVLKNDDSFKTPWSLGRIENFYVPPRITGDILGPILQAMTSELF